MKKKRTIGIIASLCLCINSFLCTAIYLPFFENGLRDYSLYYEWRMGAVVQCTACAILMAISIAGGAVALLALISAVRDTDSKISLGSFFGLSAVKTILFFLFILYLEFEGGISGGFMLLIATVIVFFIILLPDGIMCVMCFLSRKKPDSPFLHLSFISPIIPALIVLAAFIYFFPGVLFYISDYGMDGFLTMLVEDGWIIAVPIVALIFYTAGLVLMGLLIERKKAERI